MIGRAGRRPRASPTARETKKPISLRGAPHAAIRSESHARIEAADRYRGMSRRQSPSYLHRLPRLCRRADAIAFIALFCDDQAMSYPGGKGRAHHFLIGLMPPLRTYIETHLGGGAVLRAKRPASRSIGIDIDPAVIEQWRSSVVSGLELEQMDAAAFLAGHAFQGDEFVYADPPYWPDTRRRSRCYRHDYDENDHERLLDVLLRIPCPVAVSGYDNAFYRERLAGWATRTFVNYTQAGPVEETVWLNYAPGDKLHDYSYIGADFRERERIRRSRSNQIAKLRRLPALERNAIISDLADAFPAEVAAAARNKT